jgi:KaiC/GvpD/RAD55 family RecA-like ATPase
MKECLRKQQGILKATEERITEFIARATEEQNRKDTEKPEAKMISIEGRQVGPEPEAVGHVMIGYLDLDRLLSGGIPSHYAVVLTSPSCDEEDLLVRSFLENGAKQGETTFCVTIDPSGSKTLAEEFQSNFYLFVCNPQADAIVKDLPNVFKLKGVENLNDISIALTSTIHKLDPSLKGPRRICISLVSDVLLQHHAVQTRRWLSSIITELKSTEFTTLATINPQIHSPQELQAVLDIFDGEIDIYEKEIEEDVEKFLKVRRMVNQRYLEQELVLRKKG